ncbi:ABC transporter substrate-binding protein [Canibacter zhoujuaniae]|uniref:ABC transporter substrate-binding protein n=1 Tax=Canibacter zhoujuaniae TaxID=2708343 RepID=UPI001423E40C|nr:ABC transporter substrate-binding protein [Canibacter zhoujuaniae]
MVNTTKSRFFRALAACATAAVAFGTVGATASYATGGAFVAADEASDATTLRIATAGFVDSFNPFTSVYLLPTNTNRYQYENLVAYSQDGGEPVPGLAESWETDDTGKVWTFKIRKGMTWTDGEPITAKDIYWTYNQIMTVPEMAVANGDRVENFESIEAPDDHTFVITLKAAQAPNPGVEVPIVPEHIWSKLDDPSTFANDSDVVGSGPFQLTKYAANESLELVANKHYWRQTPNIDKIHYIYYTDSDAQVQALRAGNVDLVSGLTPSQFNALQNQDGITTHSGHGRRYTALYLNPGYETVDGTPYGTVSEPLRDLQVRQAIRKAVDIDTLLDKVLEGQGTKATSFIPASYATWALPANDPVIESFNPEAAKKQLDDAGWVEGADGIREKDGQRLAIKLNVDATDSNAQSIGEYLGPWLRSVGIEMTVESTDSDTLSANTDAGNYDMYISGWSINPDPNYQLSINTSAARPTKTDGSGGTSQDGFTNPEFDKLYQQQLTELDEKARAEIVHKMLAMHYEAATQVTLWYQNQLEAYRSDRFQNFGLQPSKDGVIANHVGYWGYLLVEPVGAADNSADTGNSGGASSVLWIALAVAAVAGIGGLLAVRKKKAADVE